MSTNYYGQNPFTQGHPAQQAFPVESGQYEQPYYAQPTSLTQGWLAFNDPGYVKGLLLGAAVTFVLTNPKVQRAIVKGAVTALASVQGGFEEIKEQIQDIKSEMSIKSDDAKS